jgi:hypothetical protein
MPIPKELIDAIAERVADIILDRLADGAPRLGAWHLDAFSRSSSIPRLESKVRVPPRSSMAMPHYKVDGIGSSSESSLELSTSSR